MISIIFHSVCGNTYLLADKFYQTFKNYTKDVNIYRVKDNNLRALRDTFPVAKEFYNEIIKIPETSPDQLLKSKLIIMGSPTYFGNVSAEMKAFMDSFADFWINADFAGKYFASFSSAGSLEGGIEKCLGTLNTFAQHMGMVPIPPPANLYADDKFGSAYGITHYSGRLADLRPSEHKLEIVEKYVEYLNKFINWN